MTPLPHDEHCEYHDYRDHQHRCACAERALALAHSKYNGLARTMAEAIEENTRLTDALAQAQEEIARLACKVHQVIQKDPGGCCAIGQVVRDWDARFCEVADEAEKAEIERDTLRDQVAALTDEAAAAALKAKP